jgi:hypothetical protein
MNNGQTYNLTANGPRLAERPADPANLVAFSPSGAYAYIDNSNNVRYVSSPSANPIKIGTADASTYKITMAADSSVTLYPIGNNSVKNYKTMRIKDGQTTEYKITTSGIGFLTWSPSLTKAAYTTDDGVYVYDVAKGRSTRLITVRSTEKQGIAWIDEDSFVFAFRNTLWRYTISTGTVNGLSGYIGTLSGNDPLRITDSFVYYGVTGTNNGAQAEGIYRTALSSNQQSSSTLNTPTTKYGSLNSLTSHGLSSDQMSNVQYALSKYASSLKTRPKEIVLGPITDEPKAYSEPSKIKFNLNVDGTARPARLEYSGLRVVRLYVYNAQGGVVFDSGEVN